MNNKLKYGLVAASILLLVGGGSYFYFSKSVAKQDVKNLTVKQPTKTTTTEQPSVEIKAKVTEPGVTSDQPSSPTTRTEEVVSKTIDDNIESIYNTVKSIGNFTNGSTEYYNTVVSKLEGLGVTIDESTVKVPFGIYDTNQSTQENVLAAITTYENKAKQEDGNYKIDLSIRTGRAAMIDDVDYTGNEIKKVLESPDFNGVETQVSYVLKVSEDRMSAQLVQVSTAQWW